METDHVIQCGSSYVVRTGILETAIKYVNEMKYWFLKGISQTSVHLTGYTSLVLSADLKKHTQTLLFYFTEALQTWKASNHNMRISVAV